MSNGISGEAPQIGGEGRDAVMGRGASPLTGSELRDQGIERAGSGLPVVPQVLYLHRARLAIIRLCTADGNFSSEDVRRMIGDPPHPNMMGGIFRSAVTDGLIVSAGVSMAARPQRHASLQRMWRRA